MDNYAIGKTVTSVISGKDKDYICYDFEIGKCLLKDNKNYSLELNEQKNTKENGMDKNLVISNPINPRVTVHQSYMCKQANISIVKTTILDSYEHNIESYKCIYDRQMAHDSYKKVYKITLKDNKEIALKIEEFESANRKKYQSLLREYNIGRTFGVISKNVVKSLDMKACDVNDKTRVELLTEYGGKNLKEVKPSDPFMAIYQLVNVLALMESYGIAHLDIKPENMVWNEASSILKIIDFGTSLSFLRNPEKIMQPIGEYEDRIIGFTLFFAPPEVTNLPKENSLQHIIPQKMDVFAFGITLLEILCAYKGCTQKRKVRKDYEDFANFVVEIQKILSKDKDYFWCNL